MVGSAPSYTHDWSVIRLVEYARWQAFRRCARPRVQYSRGEPLWELQDVVRPLVNPDLATLLLLYAASLTDDLPAPVSCNIPIAHPNSSSGSALEQTPVFSPEVERIDSCLISRLVCPPHGKISSRATHDGRRPRPSRAICSTMSARSTT